MISELHELFSTFSYIRTPSVKVSTDGDTQTTEKPHILAKVNWFQDHPQKLFAWEYGIILSATVCQTSYSATFLPVSRIISRCAIVERRLQMNYMVKTWFVL